MPADLIPRQPAGCTNRAEGARFWADLADAADRVDDGTTSPAEVSAAGTHLGSCPACAAAYGRQPKPVLV